MKKRLSVFLMILALFVSQSAPASASLVSSGNYWIEAVGSTEINAVVQKGATEPVLLILYSRHCGYSQEWIPQFREFAEQNKVTVYGADLIVDHMGSEDPTVRFGANVSGPVPLAIRYWGNGAPPVVTFGIRSLEAFREQVYAEPPAMSSDGFEVDSNGTLLRYAGSATQVVIPDYVTSIGDAAFAENEVLQSVSIPDSVTTLGDNVFKDCPVLTSVTMTDSVTKLGRGVFSGCDSLSYVRLSDRLTTLPSSTFSSCPSLLFLDLPKSLKTVESFAFMNTTHLREITLPAGVTSIGSYAFAGCYYLHTVRFLGSRPQMPTGDNDPFDQINAAAIYPTSDPSWSDTAALHRDHPDLNWGGRPGQCYAEPQWYKPWNDGTVASWALPEVEDTFAYELFPSGVNTNNYDKPITRQEFCYFSIQLLSKHLGINSSKIAESVGSSPFTDTKSIHVITAYTLGLVGGKGNGTFDPDGYITRQEAATLLARTARYLAMDSDAPAKTFSDQASIAPWAAESVALVTNLTTPDGRTVMGSTGSGFSPLSTYTRQEACCSFLRLYQSLVGM